MLAWSVNKLLFLLAFISFWVHSSPLRAREWFLIRILKSSQRYQLVKNELPQITPKIAVLATYPRVAMLASVGRSITLLKEQGFSVILVMNESSYTKKWADSFTGEVDALLIRPNIGRDFGAYQSGVQFLEKHGYYKSIQELILLNDSVYYTPLSVSKLKNFFESEMPWKSLFLNYRYRIHAQSFFLSFGREVLISQAFKRFWSNYYPTSIRRRVVVRGELKLTAKLLRGGFRPVPFVNSERIEAAMTISQMLPSEELAAFGDFFRSSDQSLTARIDSHQRVTLIRRVLDKSNPTHQIGLLSTRLLGTPLKLDIVKRGISSIGSVREVLVATSVPQSEIDEILSEISAGGTDVSHPGIRGLWFKFGFN